MSGKAVPAHCGRGGHGGRCQTPVPSQKPAGHGRVRLTPATAHTPTFHGFSEAVCGATAVLTQNSRKEGSQSDTLLLLLPGNREVLVKQLWDESAPASCRPPASTGRCGCQSEPESQVTKGCGLHLFDIQAVALSYWHGTGTRTRPLVLGSQAPFCRGVLTGKVPYLPPGPS